MAEDKMSLEDWLDDLCVRFIVNLGHADLSDTARICFQIEEAQWFYEDFIRPLDPQLPSMTLKQFSLKMFQHCPLFAGFSQKEHQMAFEKFLQYKTRIPVRGAIMLNAAMDSAVLVRGWKKGASWSFPRGKINKDEDDLECAMREVIEETGFDLRDSGLVDINAPVQHVEVTMKDQHVRLYVFRDVPEDTYFAPKARKEIGAIQWYKLNDLPTFKKKKGKNADSNSDRFYMVAPFMGQLRNWIKQQKKERAPPIVMDEGLTDDNVFYPQPSANNVDVDYAAKGMQNLQVMPDVLVQPQMHAGPAHEAASAHLMSLLQSNSIPGSAMQPQQQQEQQQQQQQHNHHQTPQAQMQAHRQQQEWLQMQEQAEQQHREQLKRIEQQNHEKLLREKQATEQRFQQQIKQQQQDYQHMAKQQYAQQHFPHTPQEQLMISAPQPQSPHQHHLAQRLHHIDYAQPPPSIHLPTTETNNQHYQQQQQKQSSGPTQRHVAPQHYQSAPVPLIHPQPMPAPQVVSAMVNNYGNDYNPNMAPGLTPQKNMAGPPHSSHAPESGHNGPLQQQRTSRGANLPMPAHSMNLLNAFKGGPSATKSQSQQGGASLHSAAIVPSQQTVQSSSLEMGASLRPQATSDFAPQVISGPETRPGNFGPNSPGSQPRSMDKHHMNLLDMFKVAPHPVMPNQSVRREPLQQQQQPKQQERQVSPPHVIQELPTMADVMKTAAHENGRPIQMSAETNLPYGAVAILARPQSDQKETKDVQSQAPAAQVPPQSPLRPIREPRIGSRDSSGFPSAKVSPRQIHTQSQKNVASSQPSPQGHFGKLQHGHTQSPLARMQTFGSDVSRSKSPLSQVYTSGFPQEGVRPSMMMPTPPSATHLPLPGIPKARRESTAEHKQSLLSLFGQPKGANDPAHGKGKELASPDMYGSGAHPRSRVASVASSVGTGLPNGSRRGSQSPLSSSDRNFLLGFLQTAASNKTH